MLPLPMARTAATDPNTDAALLSRTRVATPCRADWDAMIGDDRSRFCGSCRKNVYNLSAMTAAEAAALIREKEGKLCVRYYERTDGTVLTQDCPVGVAAVKRKVARVFAAGIVGFAALFSAVTQWWVTPDGGNLFADRLAFWAEKIHPTPEPQERLMGDIAVTPEPIRPEPGYGQLGNIQIDIPKTAPVKKPTIIMGAPAPMMGEAAPVMGKVRLRESPVRERHNTAKP